MAFVAHGSLADKAPRAKIQLCALLSERGHLVVDGRGQRVVRRLPLHRLKTFAHRGLAGFDYSRRVAPRIVCMATIAM
jgi:hypothetical protein